jgi:putative ABC transport system ATP-binding protein
MSLLELKNVSKIYGELKALDNVSLHVDQGEWVAIMGPSGSGKSTMMNIIGCMDKPTMGEVLLDGVDISKESSRKLTDIRRDKIGLIFQQFHMVNYLTAVENVMVSQYYHSMPDEQEALEALGRVGLRERAHHLPSQLSGGEQQRVCVARALINHPELILADEPTGNLDSKAGEEIVNLLKLSNKQFNQTVIVITHDPDIARQAGRVITIEDGRVVKDEKLG